MMNLLRDFFEALTYKTRARAEYEQAIEKANERLKWYLDCRVVNIDYNTITNDEVVKHAKMLAWHVMNHPTFKTFVVSDNSRDTYWMPRDDYGFEVKLTESNMLLVAATNTLSLLLEKTTVREDRTLVQDLVTKFSFNDITVTALVKDYVSARSYAAKFYMDDKIYGLEYGRLTEEVAFI